MEQPKAARTMVKPATAGPGPLRGFQSPEALEGATKASSKAVEDDGEPHEALVADEDDSPNVKLTEEERAATAAEMSKMVKVRARTFIPPFRYGKKTYTLPAGKEVLIPKCVQLHLIEKDLI